MNCGAGDTVGVETADAVGAAWPCSPLDAKNGTGFQRNREVTPFALLHWNAAGAARELVCQYFASATTLIPCLSVRSSEREISPLSCRCLDLDFDDLDVVSPPMYILVGTPFQEHTLVADGDQPARGLEGLAEVVGSEEPE